MIADQRHCWIFQHNKTLFNISLEIIFHVSIRNPGRVGFKLHFGSLQLAQSSQYEPNCLLQSPQIRTFACCQCPSGVMRQNISWPSSAPLTPTMPSSLPSIPYPTISPAHTPPLPTSFPAAANRKGQGCLTPSTQSLPPFFLFLYYWPRLQVDGSSFRGLDPQIYSGAISHFLSNANLSSCPRTPQLQEALPFPGQGKY